MNSSRDSSTEKRRRLPKRQKQALAVLLLCIASFAAYACAVVYLLVEDARSAAPVPPAFGAPDMPAPGAPDAPAPENTVRGDEPETPAFAGGLLRAGEDGGEAYLSETLFLGDSNMVRMYVYGLVPLRNVMAFEGIGVESVGDFPCVCFSGDSTVYTIVQAVSLVRPRRIVMTFGTNDVSEYTCEAFIENYREALRMLRGACPDSAIILASIPPVCAEREYPDIDMEKIEAFNAALLALSEELRLPFLNTAEALTGPDGFAKPEYWVEDGLHMNEDGLKEFLRYTRTHPYTPAQGPAPDGLAESPERRVPPAWQSLAG